MAKYEHIKVGKPVDIETLRAAPKPGRQPSPRDIELEKLVNEVSAGAESQVWPLALGDQKMATLRLAVNKAIKRADAKVYVSVNARAYPDTLLLSRQPLNKRQALKK